MMLRADADTKLFFLAGDPMDFSCGAAVSNAVFDFANVNAVNLSLTVKKGELGPFVKAVRTLGLAGFFVTMRATSFPIWMRWIRSPGHFIVSTMSKTTMEN